MQYKLTKKDYYKAYLLDIKPRKIYYILGILLILTNLTIVILAINSSKGEPDYKLAGILLGGTLLVLLWIYISPLHSIRKSFKQTKRIESEICLTLNEDSFSLSTETSNTKIPFEDIYKIKSNNKYLLIYENQYVYRIVPKCSQDLTEAAYLVEQKFTKLNKSNEKTA